VIPSASTTGRLRIDQDASQADAYSKKNLDCCYQPDGSGSESLSSRCSASNEIEQSKTHDAGSEDR